VLAASLLRNAHAVLADLDGTLIFGDQPAPGAIELLERFENRLAVVSNYSTMNAQAMADHLWRIGLRLPPERILLAGDLAITEVARRSSGARVLCLMTAAMRDQAEAHGLNLSDDDASVVLLGRDLDFDYMRLAAAIRAVHLGARIVVTNTDFSQPGSGRVPVPETGALLAAIVSAVPQAEIEVIGKPEPTLFVQALQILGVSSGQAVMLGDRPAMDGAGAKSAGIASILIGPFESADVTDLATLISTAFPTPLEA
jgi:HAD superfamily hydrolase (TIGR01450 family)